MSTSLRCSLLRILLRENALLNFFLLLFKLLELGHVHNSSLLISEVIPLIKTAKILEKFVDVWVSIYSLTEPRGKSAVVLMDQKTGI